MIKKMIKKIKESKTSSDKTGHRKIKQSKRHKNERLKMDDLVLAPLLPVAHFPTLARIDERLSWPSSTKITGDLLI